MRGYGESDKPFEIEAYNQVAVVNDIIGLIPALGYETAVVIGHDWGAPTAWSCALNHPDKVCRGRALRSISASRRLTSSGYSKSDIQRSVFTSLLPRTRQSRSRTRKRPSADYP